MDNQSRTLIQANLAQLRTAFVECAVRWPGVRLTVTNSNIPPANGLLQWKTAGSETWSAWLYGDTEGDEETELDLATGVFWGLAKEAGHVARGVLPGICLAARIAGVVEPSGIWLEALVAAAAAQREGSRLVGWRGSGLAWNPEGVTASENALGWTFCIENGPFTASAVLIDEMLVAGLESRLSMEPPTTSEQKADTAAGNQENDRDWMLVSEAMAELPFIANLKSLDRYAKKNPGKLRLRKHPEHKKRRQAHRADVQRLAQEHNEREFEAMDQPEADNLPPVAEQSMEALAARMAAARAKKARQ